MFRFKDLSLKTVLTFIGGVVIIAILCVVFFWASAQEFWTDTTKTIEAPENTGVTNEFIEKVVPTEVAPSVNWNQKAVESTVKEVEKEVAKIKSDKVKPIATIPSSNTKAINDKLIETKSTVNLKEKTETGDTNIYSISVRKAEHAVGLYVSVKDGPNNNKLKNTGVGVHYRNKRWVYQAGVDFSGNKEVRVAYELFQW